MNAEDLHQDAVKHRGQHQSFWGGVAMKAPQMRQLVLPGALVWVLGKKLSSLSDSRWWENAFLRVRVRQPHCHVSDHVVRHRSRNTQHVLLGKGAQVAVAQQADYSSSKMTKNSQFWLLGHSDFTKWPIFNSPPCEMATEQYM